MGTSLHAAMVGKHYIEQIAGLPAEVDNASEYRYRQPIIGPETLLISVAQSGETVDTLEAMAEAKAKGALEITVCNTPGSQATRVADGVRLHALRAGDRRRQHQDAAGLDSRALHARLPSRAGARPPRRSASRRVPDAAGAHAAAHRRASSGRRRSSRRWRTPSSATRTSSTWEEASNIRLPWKAPSSSRR